MLSSLLPLVTALLALVIGTSLIGLLSHAFDISSVSTELAVLIGLGVGVDYGLFIISRYRSAVKAGLSYADAAALAVRTSGRTVLLAGLHRLHRPARPVRPRRQLPVRRVGRRGHRGGPDHGHLPDLPAGHARLPRPPGPVPAGTRAPWPPAARPARTPAGFWLRWARFVEARKALVALGALAAVVVIALPIFGLRLGTSDASTDPAGSTTHQAYTALAQGFGPGFNGPLELAAQASSPADATAFGHLLATAAHTPGVASVTPAATSPNGKVMLATVYPATGPQASQTVGLVNNLRDHLIPRAAHGTSLAVHVGGVTATNIDFSHVLTGKLPVFIAVVVLLAFLLLMAVFRSLLIPLVASVMNLLSVGAALGALNAVFNWGWGSSILRLSGTGPIDAFIPVLLFSVLFGLSMDYEVYLVSRMQEEWHHLHHTQAGKLAALAGQATRRNHQAVTTGQANSGRDHRGRRRHHDPGLRILPPRRQPDPAGIRLRPRVRRPRRRPAHPQPAGPRPHAPHRPRQLGPPQLARPRPAPGGGRARPRDPRRGRAGSAALSRENRWPPGLGLAISQVAAWRPSGPSGTCPSRQPA